MVSIMGLVVLIKYKYDNKDKCRKSGVMIKRLPLVDKKDNCDWNRFVLEM